MHDNMGKVAEALVDECLRLEGVSTPCYDNVTLIIVSLSDYLLDYQRRNLLNTPVQLQLRKQSSVGHDISGCLTSNKNDDFAVECHSILHISSDDGRCSAVSGAASQVSTNVNPFLVTSSNPSSQTSSPQQFHNPKSDNLQAPLLSKDSSMGQL